MEGVFPYFSGYYPEIRPKRLRRIVKNSGWQVNRWRFDFGASRIEV
jgi:hypothetical protein